MPDITEKTTEQNSNPTATIVSEKDPEVQELEKHRTIDLLKKFASGVVRYVFPLAISVCLILWLLHKVDFHDVMRIIHEKCNFLWIAVMMVMTCMSMAIRGIRWGLQLQASGIKKMPVVAECVSIWGAYALNLLIPDMGEAWRCIYASKRQKAPLSTVIGTDIGDRVSDLIVIILLLILSLIVAHPFIMDFMEKYKLGQEVEQVIDNPYLWICVGALIAFLWGVFHFFKTRKWVMKLTTNLKRMWAGFKVIFTMKLWWLYLIYTLAIWLCYYSKVYLCFFSFDYTDALIHEPGTAYGLIPGLVVFVFSSISIAIPSNGGLGPWNLAVMFSLSLFGITSAEGTAFSLVVWTFETIMIVALGFFSLGYVLYTNKKRKEDKDFETKKAAQ